MREPVCIRTDLEQSKRPLHILVYKEQDAETPKKCYLKGQKHQVEHFYKK